MPAAREVRVEGERAIYEGSHRNDVLPETGKRKGSVGQDTRVVSGNRQGTARKLDALLSIRVPIRGGAVADEVHAPVSCQGERRSKMRIASDRLLEHLESLRGWRHRQGTQIEVVSA